MGRRSPHLDDPNWRPPISWEDAGPWIAFDRQRRLILASGETAAEASATAEAAGHAGYVLIEKASVKPMFPGAALFFGRLR